MSRHFVSASSQSLNRASAVIGAAPLTITAWVNPTSHVAVNDIAAIDDGAGASSGFLLRQDGTGHIAAMTGPGFQASTTAGTVTNGVWNHVAAVFASATSRIAYLNGTAATAETTSNTPGALTNTHVGAAFLPQTFYNGDIAWVNIWNIALSGAEISALAAGQDPRTMHPGNLVVSYQLLGTASPETDSIAGLNLIVTGATQGATDPPVLLIGETFRISDQVTASLGLSIALSEGFRLSDSPSTFLGSVQGKGSIQMLLNGVWTTIDDVITEAGVTWHRGFSGTGVLDCVADAGTLTFSLNNSETNSAHLVGYYSPDNANVRSGFDLNTGVRYFIGTTMRFTGFLDAIEPTSGIHESRRVACQAVDYMDVASRRTLSNVPVLVNNTGDQVFQALIDSLDAASKPVAVQRGASPDVFPYSLDKIQDGQTVLRDELYRVCLSGLSRSWIKGDGTLVYELRTLRSTAAADADAYIDSIGFTAKRDRSGVVNSVQVTVYPRTPETVSVVMYKLGAPTALVPNQTLVIVGPWTDPASPTTRVGAVSLDTVVATTDYLINSQADGLGTDLTPKTVVTVGLSGNATQFSLTLSGFVPGFITLLQQRGKPLLDYGATIVSSADAASIAAFGPVNLAIDMPYQNDSGFGLEVAQYVVHINASPLTQISGFARFVSLQNAAELSRSISREISDRVKVTESVTGVNRSFFINAITETEQEGMLRTEFLLAPVDPTAYWMLDIVGHSELDSTAIPAFSRFM